MYLARQVFRFLVQGLTLTPFKSDIQYCHTVFRLNQRIGVTVHVLWNETDRINPDFLEKNFQHFLSKQASVKRLKIQIFITVTLILFHIAGRTVEID